MKHKILIVDDEAANLRVLGRILRQDTEVLCAESGADALEILRMHDVALIISDQRMPGMTGIEFLKQAAVMRQHTVRLILTGYTDINALVEVINSGVVYKYITKPWVNEDLQQTVKRALQHYETIKARYELGLQNERLQLRLRASQEGFIKVLSDMLDFKNPYKCGHARRTEGFAVAIGKALNFMPAELEQLSIAALLHEVVDFYLPGRFLSETIKSQNQEDVKHAFEKGLKLLDNFPEMTEVVTILRYYHEHWDGTGYPYNLKGEQIPLLTRIIAVANAFDEMTARNPAEPGLSYHEGLQYLKSSMAKRFDPDVVKVFCQIIPNGQTINPDVYDEAGANLRSEHESENKLENSEHYIPIGI